MRKIFPCIFVLALMVTGQVTAESSPDSYVKRIEEGMVKAVAAAPSENGTVFLDNLRFAGRRYRLHFATSGDSDRETLDAALNFRIILSAWTYFLDQAEVLSCSELKLALKNLKDSRLIFDWDETAIDAQILILELFPNFSPKDQANMFQLMKGISRREVVLLRKRRGDITQRDGGALDVSQPVVVDFTAVEVALIDLMDHPQEKDKAVQLMGYLKRLKLPRK